MCLAFLSYSHDKSQVLGVFVCLASCLIRRDAPGSFLSYTESGYAYICLRCLCSVAGGWVIFALVDGSSINDPSVLS